jgi:hypothetical protein
LNEIDGICNKQRENVNAYGILVEKPRGRRPRGEHLRKEVYNNGW